jgi:hypothetical protein
VVSYGAKVAGRNRPQMGMIAHTNTKQKGVSNMRHFVNDMKVVEFRDIETLKEFKEFVSWLKLESEYISVFLISELPGNIIDDIFGLGITSNGVKITPVMAEGLPL